MRHRRTRADETSDELLIRRVRAGDEAAFEALVRRHRPAVQRYVDGVLRGTPADAEAVTQDVLLRAYRALLRDERHVVVRPWLRRIAHRRCLDALGGRREAAVAPDRFEDLPDAGGDPADRAIRRAELDEVVTAVRDLPAPQRRALVGQELEGRSQADLAHELGTSVAAVKSMVGRSRRRLAAAMRGLAPAGLAARVAELVGRSAETKAATVAAATVAAAGGAVGVTHVVVDPDRSPAVIPGGEQLAGRPIRAGTPLPPGLALVTRRVALEPGLRRPGPQHRLRLACPAGHRVAGLFDPDGNARRLREYDLASSVHVGRSRRAVVEYRAAPRLSPPATVAVGMVCRRPR